MICFPVGIRSVKVSTGPVVSVDVGRSCCCWCWDVVSKGNFLLCYHDMSLLDSAPLNCLFLGCKQIPDKFDLAHDVCFVTSTDVSVKC